MCDAGGCRQHNAIRMDIDHAKEFFASLEDGKGWAAVCGFCSPAARFSAQVELLAKLNSIEEYADWRASMRDRAVEAAPDCKWVLEHASWDKDKRTIACYGVASGTHTGPGGPVPATGRSVASEYVYILHVDETGRFDRMTLVWNAGWAMRELGWAS